MAAKKKKSKDVKCKMVATGKGDKKIKRCFKNGKFVKTPKK